MNDIDQQAIKAVRSFKTREEIAAAGFVPGWHGETVNVGDLAVVWGHNGWRQGVVTKVTAKTVHARFTTPGAVDTAKRDQAMYLSPNLPRLHKATLDQEGSNWDYYQSCLNRELRSWERPDSIQRWAEYVAEGREAYAGRLADRAVARAEAASEIARGGWEHYANLTNGKGDRTGARTNLYVKGA